MGKDNAKGTIGDALGGVWDSVSGWAGQKIKEGATWATRQATDGVTSAFTGNASPEGEKGGLLEPGSAIGKMFNDAPWWAKMFPLIGMFFGYKMSDTGPIDTLTGMLKGAVLATVGVFALSWFLKANVQEQQLAAAHNNATAKPEAQINLNIPGGKKPGAQSGLEHPTPSNG